MLKALFRAAIILAALLLCLMIAASVLGLTTAAAIPVVGVRAFSGVIRVPLEVVGGLASFAFTLGSVFVLGFLICLAVLALRLLGDHDRPESRDKSRTLLEVHRGLSRLEERIEALETLLLTERERAGRPRARV